MTEYTSMPNECASTEIPHAYSCLFRSNSCPSAEACADIKSLIEEHELQLVTIQDQVERLKKCLADTERCQIQTKDTLVKLHAALAPIRCLPPDVLSEIFLWCLDARNSGVLPSMAARNSEAPLLLGHVCRSWRAIAHATPRLWQDIFVNVCDGRYANELRRDALPALQMWLAHSGSLPLNLVVLCDTERVLPGLQDLFETIAAHATRWQAVQVHLQNSPMIYGLVCRTFTKCTSLSTFDVTDGGQCMSFFGHRQSDGVKDVKPVCFDLSPAPLHQLSLSLADLTIRDVHAPWSTLTRLSFMRDARPGTTSITDYVAVLQQCTSLKECGITINGGIQDAPLEPFTLPSLECLELQVHKEASQTTQMSDFLSALDAPRLWALSIEDYCLRREGVVYHSQLTAFLQGHAQLLRRLKFATGSKFFTSEDLIALIVKTPLLTELEYHLGEESSPKALLEALTPRMQGDVLECLLPCLERFFLDWDTPETVSMVGDMIEKRYALVERGIARLQYLSCKPVKICFVYEYMPLHVLVENLAVRLEPLCRRGLEVDWEGYT